MEGAVVDASLALGAIRGAKKAVLPHQIFDELSSLEEGVTRILDALVPDSGGAADSDPQEKTAYQVVYEACEASWRAYYSAKAVLSDSPVGLPDLEEATVTFWEFGEMESLLMDWDGGPHF